MFYVAGDNIDENDVVEQSAGVADAGKGVKTNSEGFLDESLLRVGGTRSSFLAGEAIDTTANAKHVYLKSTDGRVYLTTTAAADEALKYIGVAIKGQNKIAGEQIIIITKGVAGDLPAMTIGDRHFVSATAGVTSNVVDANYPVMAGVAVTANSILIKGQRRRKSGLITFTASGTTSISVGFRADKVTIKALSNAPIGGIAEYGKSHGDYNIESGNNCITNVDNATGPFEKPGFAWYFRNSGSDGHRGTVGNITDDGFDLVNIELGSGTTCGIHWEAEGDF